MTVCFVCGCTPITAHVIDKTLPADLQKYFLVNELWNALQTASNDHEKQQLEAEIESLKLKLNEVKKELQSGAVQMQDVVNQQTAGSAEAGISGTAGS
ncbi:unnamed protein product [Gongylonema pulchrum]|uniref:Secreted protein n=1 Tax=Gongylonema pulchrum TaxID=637853 RepID=A0A183DX13_9BILA|nr:unnamed protein product [Gongylonema pulchrum]